MARLLLALAVLAVVYAARINLEQETTLRTPRGWLATTDKPDLMQERTFYLLVKQRNVEKLEAAFWAVSTPGSGSYSKWLSNDEITDLVAPSGMTLNTITDWLEQHSVTWALTRHRDMVKITAPLVVAAKLFGVEYKVYRHTNGAKYTASLGPYSVPEEIAVHLDMVSNVVGLPRYRANQKLVSHPTRTSMFDPDPIDPAVIRTRYNVPGDLIGRHPNNSHAVAEFQAQYYSPSDLADFFKLYVNNSDADTISKLVGTNDPDAPSGEGSLDIQFQMGVAPNVSTWFYSIASSAFWSDLTAWQAELQEDGVPWVHSISYGSEGEYPSTSYMQRADVEYMAMGARGISIIYASGDTGACGDGWCFDLEASYPAISVYVTSVGATEFISGNSGNEAAVSQFKSGGGFSKFSNTPTYQQAAVKHYLSTATKLPDPKAYNPNGRSTPDVSALGSEHFTVVINGEVTPIGGTSASAPTFAAIIVLLNDYRLFHGNTTMGFLNPWIYNTWTNHPETFNDITEGTNACFIVNDEVTAAPLAGLICGYDAIPGYDPVTGVGTPNFGEMIKYVL